METTDSNIGSLKKATYLAGDSLLVAEQQGEAVAVEGQLLAEFAQEAAEPQVERAQTAAMSAEMARDSAKQAQTAIENMDVRSESTPPGTPATVQKIVEGGKVTLAFGIPKGESGVIAPVNGFFTMTVDEEGNLYAISSGGNVPEFEYDPDTGDLYFITSEED